MLLMASFGSGISGVLSSKFKLASWCLLIGSALQALGIGLLSILPNNSESVSGRTYGFQVILGLGFGLLIAPLFVLLKIEAESDTFAAATGCLSQFRFLGGVIGLAVAQAIFIERLHSGLHTVVSQEVIREILEVPTAIERLPPPQMTAIRAAYGTAFNDQARVITYISIGVFIAACFTFNGRDVSLAEVGEQQAASNRRDTASEDLEQAPPTPRGSGVQHVRTSSDVEETLEPDDLEKTQSRTSKSETEGR